MFYFLCNEILLLNLIKVLKSLSNVFIIILYIPSFNYYKNGMYKMNNIWWELLLYFKLLKGIWFD
jgi:hypothetical protein